jgi:hypothetical protein
MIYRFNLLFILIGQKEEGKSKLSKKKLFYLHARHSIYYRYIYRGMISKFFLFDTLKLCQYIKKSK